MKTLYTYTEFINESLLVEGDLLKMEVTDEVAKKIDSQFRKMVKDKIAKSGNTKNKELPQFLDFEKNPNSYYLKAIQINKSQNTLLLSYAGGVGNYYVIVFYDKKTGDLKGPDYLQENPSNWTKRQNAEYSWYQVDKKTGERKSSQVWFNVENKKNIMNHIQSFDQFINESLITESSKSLLADIFKEAKKSKNFSKVEMTNRNSSDADFVGDYIYIKSKLKGTSEYHKNDFDEFSIGIDKESGDVILIYEPNGYDEEITTVQQFKDMTRA